MLAELLDKSHLGSVDQAISWLKRPTECVGSLRIWIGFVTEIQGS